MKIFKSISFACICLLITLCNCCQRTNPAPVSNINSTHQELDITMEAQENNLWCWAACMEMVIKYHEPNNLITQCELAFTNYLVQNNYSPNTPLPPIQRDSCCLNMCSNPSCSQDDFGNCANSTCNQEIESYFNGSQHFERIFSRFQFSAKEDSIKITWDQIKNEIQKCRPFIIVINRAIEEVGVHAVVIKGYKEEENGIKKLIVLDPWEHCLGCVDTLLYPLSYTEDFAPWVIYDIHNKWLNECISCSGKEKKIKTTNSTTPSFANVLESKLNECLKNNTSNLPIEDCMKAYPNLIFSIKKYFSFDKLTQNTDSIFDLNKVTNMQQIVDIKAKDTSNFKGSISFIYNGKSVHLKTVTPCTYYEDNEQITIFESKLNLSNNSTLIGTTPYEIIEYPLFHYRFYSFNYAGKTYLSPVETYPSLKINQAVLRKGQGTESSLVIKNLSDKSKKYKEIYGLTRPSRDDKIIDKTNMKYKSKN